MQRSCATVPDRVTVSVGRVTQLKLYDCGLTGRCTQPDVVPELHLTCACTELPSTIGNLKALKTLDVQWNSLQGEHLCSTRTTSDPADTVACSVARLDWRASGAREADRIQQQHCWYVLL